MKDIKILKHGDSIKIESPVFNTDYMSVNEFLELKNKTLLDEFVNTHIPICVSSHTKDVHAKKLYYKIQITKLIEQMEKEQNQSENSYKAYGGQELADMILSAPNPECYLRVSDDFKNSFINQQKTIQFGRTSEYYKQIPSPFEYQYAQSLNRLLTEGVECENRTGINTRVVQHQYFYIPNITENFPILRGKKLWPKMALKECLWMLMGKNDLKWLNDRKVTYWNEWSLTEETIDKFDLDAEWIGTIGKSYGYQYRNFNGFDQVKALVENMKKDPMGRRHIINLWNSADLHQMALPPCMYDFHFECTPVHRITNNNSQVHQQVANDIYYIVDLHAHVRSNDSFLGAPYDFMFCGWLLNIICNYLNHLGDGRDGSIYYKPNDIHYTADNYHLYINHIDAAKQYLANVDENLSGIIDIPSIIAPCFLDDFYHHIEQPLTIDEYLEMLDNNMKYINIQLQAPQGIHEYGPIKAEIAV